LYFQDMKTQMKDTTANQFFNCREVRDLYALSAQYEDSAIVRKFIINRCHAGGIVNRTWREMFLMIERELGFPQPKLAS